MIALVKCLLIPLLKTPARLISMEGKFKLQIVIRMRSLKSFIPFRIREKNLKSYKQNSSRKIRKRKTVS
jgi:hypothetical protein